MKTLLLLILLTATAQFAGAQIVMIGPMVHLNFEGKKAKPSFAIEASYWALRGFPYGVDAAIEFQKGKTRVYTEAQTGIGIAGIGAGPFLEFSKNAPAKAGLQLTGWVNYFVGLDARVRFYKGPDVFAAGIYGKVPAYVKKKENGSSEFNWWDVEDWTDWD